MSKPQVSSSKKSPRAVKIVLVVLGVLLVAGIVSVYALRYYVRRNTWSSRGPSGNNCKPGYPCAIPENEGKVKVSNTSEVRALAEKYGWEHVHVQALDINLVKDIEFIKQIHPNFKEQTGCIIIAHAGDEGYVYQEDKSLNIIYRETLKEFIEKTRGVDSDLMSKFYLSFH